LGKERSNLEQVVETIDKLDQGVNDTQELLDMIVEECDESALGDIQQEIDGLNQQLEILEFRRMFSGETDPNNAYLDIQSGSGGTEAQDWAEMVLRMYLRWGEAKGFKTTLEEASAGDVAGIKSATIHFSGEYAFGWLRTEDVREDTYRASGAGGQHVNKTDSAVRLTHIASGIVVQCQSQRSQHQNRDAAWKMLRAKLYEQEMLKRNADKQAMEDNKSDIGWGSQIRSYVLDDQRIKDLRTHVQSSNCQSVLDGDLDPFIEASLKAGL